MRARVPIRLTLLTLLFACSSDRPAPLAPNGAASDNSPTISASATASQIARLRQLVAPFHDFDTAVRPAGRRRSPPASWRPTCRANPGPARWDSTSASSRTSRTGAWSTCSSPSCCSTSRRRMGSCGSWGWSTSCRSPIIRPARPRRRCWVRVRSGAGVRRLGAPHLGGPAKPERDLRSWNPR